MREVPPHSVNAGSATARPGARRHAALRVGRQQHSKPPRGACGPGCARARRDAGRRRGGTCSSNRGSARTPHGTPPCSVARHSGLNPSSHPCPRTRAMRGAAGRPRIIERRAQGAAGAARGSALPAWTRKSKTAKARQKRHLNLGFCATTLISGLDSAHSAPRATYWRRIRPTARAITVAAPASLHCV